MGCATAAYASNGQDLDPMSLSLLELVFSFLIIRSFFSKRLISEIADWSLEIRKLETFRHTVTRDQSRDLLGISAVFPSGL